MLCGSLDTFEIARMESLQEEYILNHPLEHFMSYRKPRKHRVKAQTDMASAKFSLRQMKPVNHGFSLKTMTTLIAANSDV